MLRPWLLLTGRLHLFFFSPILSLFFLSFLPVGAVYTLPLCLPPEHQYLSEERFYTSSALGLGGCCSGNAP